MSKFYKITQDQSKSIGEFFYDEDKMFSPFVGLQEDDTYLVSEDIYLHLKDYDEFKKIEWDTLELISSEDVKLKSIPPIN